MDSSQQVSTISIAVAIVINWLYGLGLKRQENNNTGGRGAGHANNIEAKIQLCVKC